MESILIDINRIQSNEGQIKGVPSNPRTISKEKLDALKYSITSLPDMLSMRELLVFPLNDGFVVLGGNMRYHACVELGYKELPCKVVKETSPEKLRAIVMQDNNSYGQTDWDMIAKDWDLEELKNWSIDFPKDWEGISPDNFSDGFLLPSGEKPNSERITFTLSSEQAECIKTAVDKMKSMKIEYEAFGNDNTNGNALYAIIKQWEEQKKS